MAILGWGDYLCEACRWFDRDGLDGNHPSCFKQSYGLGESDRAVRLGEECPFGYEFGVPYGYSGTKERRERRAYEIKAMMDKEADL